MHNCGVKGNNTYQIVYRGASDAAMDGTGVRDGKSLCSTLNGRGGGKKQPLVYSDMSCSHIFSEKGKATARHNPKVLTELNQN
jgi:hypothetical protein